MSTFQYPPENIKTWYGTTTIQRCKKVGNSLTPIQVLGLVPCDSEIYKFSCSTFIGGNSNLIDSGGFKLEDSDGNLLIDNVGAGSVTYSPKLRNRFLLPVFEGDYNSFLFEYPTLDTTEDFRLFKWDYTTNQFEEVAQLTDNTYGTLYPLNTIPNYPEYAGFYIDWGSVYASFGKGDYMFSAYSASSPESSLFSYIFRLEQNNENYKDGTFTLAVNSVGLFDNPFYSAYNGIVRQWDLIDLEWKDQCRYYGKLYPTAFETETKYIRTNGNSNDLYYADKYQMYDLSVRYITFNLLQRLEFYGMASESILTDDNEDSVSNFFENIELISNDSTSFSTVPSNREVHEVVLQLKNKHSQNFRPK